MKEANRETLLHPYIVKNFKQKADRSVEVEESIAQA